MPGTYRDELEATRARKEALEEELEEMREREEELAEREEELTTREARLAEAETKLKLQVTSTKPKKNSRERPRSRPSRSETDDATTRELAVARLDREWQVEESTYKRSYNGHMRVPTRSQLLTLITGVFLGVPVLFGFGVWLLSSPLAGKTAFVPFVGALVFAVVAYIQYSQMSRTIAAHADAKSRYERRRAALLAGEYEAEADVKRERKRKLRVEPRDYED
jgi:hypothetical protein